MALPSGVAIVETGLWDVARKQRFALGPKPPPAWKNVMPRRWGLYAHTRPIGRSVRFAIVDAQGEAVWQAHSISDVDGFVALDWRTTDHGRPRLMPEAAYAVVVELEGAGDAGVRRFSLPRWVAIALVTGRAR